MLKSKKLYLLICFFFLATSSFAEEKTVCIASLDRNLKVTLAIMDKIYCAVDCKVTETLTYGQKNIIVELIFYFPDH